MFGIGMPELLLILAVALIILGPKKLPEIARSLGKAMGEFKRATSDLKQTIEHEAGLNDVRDSLRETHYDLQRAYHQEENGPAAPTPTDIKESVTDESGPTEPVKPAESVAEPTADEQIGVEPIPSEKVVAEPSPGEQTAMEPTTLADEALKHGDHKENGAV